MDTDILTRRQVRTINENSLKNLRPFQPGVSGNSAGRPSAGAAYREWVNQLCQHSEADLKAIIDDTDTPAIKRSAARDLLDGARGDYFNATPLRANPLERLCDRTEGRPLQQITVQRQDRPRSEILDDLAQLIGALRDIAPEALIGSSLPMIEHDSQQPVSKTG